MSRGGQSYRVLESAARDYRLHKRASRFGDASQYPPVEDEFLYGPVAREIDTPENRARAAKEWAEIPDNIHDLKKWMKGGVA